MNESQQTITKKMAANEVLNQAKTTLLYLYIGVGSIILTPLLIVYSVPLGVGAMMIGAILFAFAIKRTKQLVESLKSKYGLF